MFSRKCIAHVWCIALVHIQYTITAGCTTILYAISRYVIRIRQFLGDCADAVAVANAPNRHEINDYIVHMSTGKLLPRSSDL